MIALLPVVLAFQISSAPVQVAGLVAVLQQTYPADPASAIPTAQQLAAMDDEIAQGAFDDWIQKRVAPDFAPLMNARAKSESADAFLRAMAEPSTNGLTADATAGLRMWADAQTTSDVQRLRLLAATEFPGPASLGARYQLLLADLLERRPEGDLAAAGRALRDRILASLLDCERRSCQETKGRVEYWAAYAFSRRAAASTRMAADATPAERRQLLGSAFVDDGNAAAQTNLFGRRSESEWAQERAALGSRREYISAHIADLEDLARRQDAKGNGAGAALTRERANHWRDVLAELRKP